MGQWNEKADDLIARYSELQRRFGHAPRRPEDRRHFDNAQRELWALAQAICQLTYPHIQHELDAARRDVMAQVNLHIENAGPVEVRPHKQKRPITWPEFQLTPELSIDPTITGACVTIEVAKRLQKAHKLQVQMVYAATRRR